MRNSKKIGEAIKNQVSGGGGGISAIIEGSNITVDNTNPLYPIVSATIPSSGVASALVAENITSGDITTTINSTMFISEVFEISLNHTVDILNPSTIIIL